MSDRIGVWLDSREANIIKIINGDITIENIKSEIEDFHPIGGSRSNVVYGPVETVSESQYSERRKHQENQYFDKVIDVINGDCDIVIFGPAQSKDRFCKKININKRFKIDILDCLKADSMTENQMKAYVRDYFEI